MLDLLGLELRSAGETLDLRSHSLYGGRQRCQLPRLQLRTASTGEAGVYLHAAAGARDGTGEVFSLFCYPDQDTERELRQRRSSLPLAFAADVEGELLNWVLGIGVTMIHCRVAILNTWTGAR